MYLKGEVGLELIPQGTIVERMRAHAAGMPAIFTPTGAHTAVEAGGIPIRYNLGGPGSGVLIPGNKKEAREFDGRRYLLEPAIGGDVAFVHAWKADEAGNCIFKWVHALRVIFFRILTCFLFRDTANNFNAIMARAAKLTIVEVRLSPIPAHEVFVAHTFPGRTNCAYWISYSQ